MARKLAALADAIEHSPADPLHIAACARSLRSLAGVLSDWEREAVPPHLRDQAAPVVSLAERRRAL